MKSKHNGCSHWILLAPLSDCTAVFLGGFALPDLSAPATPGPIWSISEAELLSYLFFRIYEIMSLPESFEVTWESGWACLKIIPCYISSFLLLSLQKDIE